MKDLDWKGVSHGSELSYIFGYVLRRAGYTYEERQLSRRMMQYIGNFVKFG